ncbi:secreted RxLR effector protein 161-like [Dioscorea cayenensis subsp. rotundata]|uniref:Secreted RxLR effector protein 161-like n=1 Tax=Dioscorea cayennensis subsp. rotundata TaxID=55577 RepID=A0AB40C7L6_DIOCR|nr:secreted RxLR effector protein 161-like [Dioscorea cayenensis subsp. rotundata]
MSVNQKLTKDEYGKDVDPSLYRSIIGNLLYLIASRPDISFSVGVCARYQATPKESHLKVVKRIIKYVHGTAEYEICYSKDSNSHLTGYSDADWTGNIDDRERTSGGCFYLGNKLVTWYSKKQSSISLSIAEAKYIAAGSSESFQQESSDAAQKIKRSLNFLSSRSTDPIGDMTHTTNRE